MYINATWITTTRTQLNNLIESGLIAKSKLHLDHNSQLIDPAVAKEKGLTFSKYHAPLFRAKAELHLLDQAQGNPSAFIDQLKVVHDSILPLTRLKTRKAVIKDLYTPAMASLIHFCIFAIQDVQTARMQAYGRVGLLRTAALTSHTNEQREASFPGLRK